jgi:hypothetical protein
VKIRLHDRSWAAKAARAPGTRSAPEPVGATWARAELREQIQRIWGEEAQAAEPANMQTREIDRSPTADREPEP